MVADRSTVPFEPSLAVALNVAYALLGPLAKARLVVPLQRGHPRLGPLGQHRRLPTANNASGSHGS
jgi:hypothetical protein